MTDDILLVIFKSLDLLIPDHGMVWAAWNLAYFGFLRSAELNLASFSDALYLNVEDIAVDSDTNPSCLKASKTVPLRKGCFFHIGRGNYPLCALQSICQLGELWKSPVPIPGWPPFVSHYADQLDTADVGQGGDSW